MLNRISTKQYLNALQKKASLLIILQCCVIATHCILTLPFGAAWLLQLRKQHIGGNVPGDANCIGREGKCAHIQ